MDTGNRIVQSLAPAASPGNRVDVQIPLATLAPGPYVLRAAVSNQKHAASREIGFVVRPGIDR